jgi:hypothetical protein
MFQLRGGAAPRILARFRRAESCLRFGPDVSRLATIVSPLRRENNFPPKREILAVGIEPVAYPGFGNNVARRGRIGFKFLS